MVNVCSFIVKFHRIHNQCKIYSKITVKGNLRPTILMKHLTFVHHESMQHNQNYCHEKATWYERNAFVLNLGFFFQYRHICFKHIYKQIKKHFFCTDHDDAMSPGNNLARLWFGAKENTVSDCIQKKLAFLLWCIIFIVLQKFAYFLALSSLKIIRATGISKVWCISLPRKT